MAFEEDKARFQSKYTTKSNGCMLWNSPLDKDGYGTFYFARRNRRAHRVAWFFANGEIPEGLVVNHKCKNHGCVNPQHLEVVTKKENALKDSVSIPALNARKTHCPNGHPYDGTQTIRGKVQRICTICTKEKHRRLRAKWRDEDPLKGKV